MKVLKENHHSQKLVARRSTPSVLILWPVEWWLFATRWALLGPEQMNTVSVLSHFR